MNLRTRSICIMEDNPGKQTFVLYHTEAGEYLDSSDDISIWQWGDRWDDLCAPVMFSGKELHGLHHGIVLNDLYFFIGDSWKYVVCFPINFYAGDNDNSVYNKYVKRPLGRSVIDCMSPYNLDDFKDECYNKV